MTASPFLVAICDSSTAWGCQGFQLGCYSCLRRHRTGRTGLERTIGLPLVALDSSAVQGSISLGPFHAGHRAPYPPHGESVAMAVLIIDPLKKGS